MKRQKVDKNPELLSPNRGAYCISAEDRAGFAFVHSKVCSAKTRIAASHLGDHILQCYVVMQPMLGEVLLSLAIDKL